MDTNDRLLFVIQARSGSTRLPGKILLPFDGERTILQMLLSKLQAFPDTDILVATTTNPHDDSVAQLAQQAGVSTFRGSEDDVLQRFIDGAEHMGASRLIRICSDNPFIDSDSIRQLIDCARANPEADYISFNINGTPSIKTHYGFWTEYVTLDALRRVKALTDERLYYEHVTNYIYTHPEGFDIKWIEGPGDLLRDLPIRLTIDTAADYSTAQMIYKELGDGHSLGDVVAYIKERPALLESMKCEIVKNSK